MELWLDPIVPKFCQERGNGLKLSIKMMKTSENSNLFSCLSSSLFHKPCDGVCQGGLFRHKSLLPAHFKLILRG
jgi:hypothetical protein